MASVHDVVQYILKKHAPISAMKLQKLLYYSQAWHLVWEDRALFHARIEAWANGPVIPEVYRYHRQQFRISVWPLGSAGNLKPEEQSSVDAVLNFYGDKSPLWLSDLTHMEDPWRNARKGLGPSDAGQREITPAAMAEYYSSIREQG